MTAIIWIYTHRKEIFITFLVIFFFILWFVIERQADRISSQKQEIAKLRVEIEQLQSKIEDMQADTAAVAAYLKRIESIDNNRKTEVKKNEECVSHRDPDAFIDRLNQLFGVCADEAGNPAGTL
ncbi:hypothetical protein IKS86_04520 [bacterium]|nr:hypothetical protein [bacterium]